MPLYYCSSPENRIKRTIEEPQRSETVLVELRYFCSFSSSYNYERDISVK